MAFWDYVAANESGAGGYYAKNPLSSATGKYQMTKPFFQSLLRKYKPEYLKTLGGPDAAWSAHASNPKLQEEFRVLGDRDNEFTAKNNNMKYDDSNKGVFWRLGAPNAMKVFSAAPNTPLETLLGSEIMRVNPDLRGKTAGDIIAKNGYPNASGTGFGKSPMGVTASGGVGGGAGSPMAPGPMALGQPGGGIQPPMNETVTGDPMGVDGGRDYSFGTKDYFRRGLLGAGAGLSSIDNPGGAAVALGMMRDMNAEDEWDLVSSKYGTYKYNKKTGQIKQVSAGASADDDATKAFNTQEGKEASKDLTKSLDAARDGSTRLVKLRELRSLLTEPGVYQGPLGDYIADLKAAAQTFGFDSEKIVGADASQAARALSNQFSLSIRNPKAGEGLPGNLSDKDLAFLKDSFASLGKTPMANEKIIDFMEAIEKRNMDYNQEKARFIAENKGRKGLAEHMEEWRNSQDALAPEGYDASTDKPQAVIDVNDWLNQ
jgi:hypothetical protein